MWLADRLSQFVVYVCLVALLWSSAAVCAETPQTATPTGEAWLVSFAPGATYWERFGHNAIWIREPALSLDHTFNFGFFDFEQKDFFLQVLQGRMMYFSVAQPAEREFQFYRSQNRSIRLQKLDLNAHQYQTLRDHLLNEIRPENRDYPYDYYLNNCSTRIRDVLDIALDGALSKTSKARPALLNFRQQTRRLTEPQYWYYLGLELALGYPVDRAISRWQEMFIPMVLAEEIADLSVSGKRLVSEDRLLFESSSPAAVRIPSSVWLRYLTLGLLVITLAWVSVRFMPPMWPAALSQAWLLLAATGGLLLAFLWLFTDHSVAQPNINILLLNPLFLFALLPLMRPLVAYLLVAGVLICAGFWLLPLQQYNLDVLALFAPINLATAAYLLRNSKKVQQKALLRDY